MDINIPNNIPNQEPVKKPHKFWKSCGLILLIIFLLLGGTYGYLFYKARDITSFDDSDLELNKVEIPDAENSYFDLAKIKDVIYFPTEDTQKITDMIDGKNWDQAYVQDLIAKNQQALIYFDQADQKAKFVVPYMAKPEKINVNNPDMYSSTYRQITRIQSLRSQMLFQEGKKEEAFNEALKIPHLGYKLSNYQPNLIQFLVGLAINKIGWNQLDALITNGNLSSEFLQSKKETLNQYKSLDMGLKTALKTEYIFFSQTTNGIANDLSKAQNTIDSSTEDTQTAEDTSQYQSDETKQLSTLLTKIMPKNFYFQPNKTNKLYADLIRAQMQIQCGQNPTTLSNTNVIPTSKIKLIFTDNAIGKVLANMSQTTLSNISTKKCEAENLADKVINKIK